MVLGTMARSISDEKDFLAGKLAPVLHEAELKTADNVFRCVTTTLDFDGVDKLLDGGNVFRERLQAKSLIVRVIPVTNKANLHIDLTFLLAVLDDFVDDLVDGLLSLFNPLAHGRRHIQDEANLDRVMTLARNELLLTLLDLIDQLLLVLVFFSTHPLQFHQSSCPASAMIRLLHVIIVHLFRFNGFLLAFNERCSRVSRLLLLGQELFERPGALYRCAFDGVSAFHLAGCITII